MVTYSGHAQKQLKKRKIPKGQILFTVEKPEEVIPSFRGRVLRRRIFSKKVLEVVTVTEGARITVVTAYYVGE